MLFPLKFQRNNRQNTLAMHSAKGKAGGRGCIFYRAVEMKQPHTMTEPFWERFPLPRICQRGVRCALPKCFVPTGSPFMAISEEASLWWMIVESGSPCHFPLLPSTFLTFFRFFPKVYHFTREPSSKNTLWSGRGLWGKQRPRFFAHPLPLFPIRRRPACTTSTI